ncbi:hypothetical protein BDU57DRAFT_544977 [Ampelomyces quisqualis]|uniref:Nudix hydrolase domain-containing protein n=1 Tax=Ampelomyces quisqualis TaxID=50730 RepID=A0A6A5R283_AMPQU|nr:hypothetical protein BDU57DRAFT_544977 [Ampelomyces quisqualis]
MTTTKMTLVDWLDDLCVRFIVNLPNEELQSVERICFQIEEAQWFYEDFIRPLDPNNLPSMHLRKFSQLIFQHCPLFSAYSEELHQQAYEQFLAYKTRVPVRGAIMLNQDMTHAVLVKGWKKGAKWSFPRGKINKEEADLDCAVREVWEETGYDLLDANLVLPDEHMKHITVTMREQTIMLYVFRGVPMDTYFEPRTRKEISKIDWYKLTDLPTLRRKNQAQPQGAAQDAIKENSFYMVAPFLGPLRAWIKQQHKLDRQSVPSTAHLAPPVGMPVADDEELQAEMQPQADPAVDPAAELKRLLSVGMGMQSPPAEAPGTPMPGHAPQVNPLLALFQQGNNKPASPQPSLPSTPFDQVMPPPVQPQSPHGQHHPRPPQLNNMPPPPTFPFSPHHQQHQHHQHQSIPLHGPQPAFNNNGMHAMFQSPQQMAGPPPHDPSFQQIHDRHAFQSEPFPASQSRSFGAHGPGPAIPPASKLPVPRLNAHTLGLLNSFRKSNAQSPGPESSQATVHAQSPQIAPQIQQQPAPRHQPNELASPHFQSPPTNMQPAQPKPRSAHQDSLLTLFRSTPPISSPEPAEPAELSAFPTTPGYASTQLATKSAKPQNTSLLDMFGNQPKPAGITSATIHGPVNAPDFATMKKNTLPASASSRGPSPAFVPQQILKRERSVPQRASDIKIGGGRNGAQFKSSDVTDVPPTAFKPQILKRPQQDTTKALLQNVATSHHQSATMSHAPQPTAHAKSLLDMFKGPSPQPATIQPAPPTRSPAPPAMAQQSFDRRESFPSDQKNTLLALFSKPEGSQVHAPLQQKHSPIPLGRSPMPPTPKTAISGMISPALGSVSMKLSTLLLLALGAAAIAVPAPQSDALAPTDTVTSDLVGVELPGSIGAALDKHLWPFEWSTTEYCENGKVRVSGTFAVPGFRNDFTLDGGQSVFVKLFGTPLTMTYYIKGFHTRFQYGPECKWGLLSTWCGQCNNMAWNGGELDCKNGDTNAKRSRIDKCYVKADESKSNQEDSKAIAARQSVKTDTASIPETPAPGTPLLFDITTDATHGEDLPDPQPDFWYYQLEIMEYWNGDLLQATGDLYGVGVNARFHFSGEESFMWAKINDKYLHIEYDFHNHWTNFAYDSYTWGMDIYAASARGMCWSDKGWSKGPLAYKSLGERIILLTCYVYTGHLSPKGDSGEQIKTVEARQLAQKDSVTSASATYTQSAKPLDTAGTADRIGYFEFSLSVTEYCEASEGTPLMARGWWSPKDSDVGQKVWFGGDQATFMSLGYPPFSLQVGPYDFWTRQVSFHYGGCHWDQDTDGIGKCGMCKSSAWSADGINCATNAAAGRTHMIECAVAVQYESGDSPDQPKLLNPRDNNSTVTKTLKIAEALKATTTRTLVPEVIATRTAPNSETTILPFHFTVTEYCNSGKKSVKGRYSAAGISADVDLWPGLIVAIAHRVPNFPPFQVGDFDYNKSRLRFAYSNGPIQCEWFDEETWKQCGECRAGLWSGGPLDCGAGGTRTKEMDCSFILGTTH